MTRTITTADLAPLVTRHGADFETSKWTVELGFPASEPVSIHSWQADLLAAIPSAPAPVVSDAAVDAAARALAGIVDVAEDYWRECSRAALSAALPLLGAAPSATREDDETITIPRPHVPHGPAHLSRDAADADYLWKAARDLERHYKPFGSDLRATVVALIRDAADAIATRTDR